MLKLKLGTNQILAIDENRKICKVFYNFNQAKEYVDRKNEDEYHNYMIEEHEQSNCYDKYDFYPSGCGWSE